jgi:hypothetical protein
MTITDITSDRRRAPVSVLLAHAWATVWKIPMTLMAVVMAMPGVMARYHQRCRDDETGAISVEQFAWIGIALFLIVAAAAALKIYWGDVSTFVTSSWSSITGQGGS